MKNTRKLVFMALFISLEIVLTRLVGLMPSNFTRISLSFVVYAFAGTLYGPVYTAITAGLGDLLGAILFPPVGGFFPGFTLSAMISGFIMGFIVLDEKKYTKVSVLLILKTLIVDFGLNTLWLTILMKTSFIPLLLQRLPGIMINNVLRFSILFLLMNRMHKGIFRDEDRHSNRTKHKATKD